MAKKAKKKKNAGGAKKHRKASAPRASAPIIKVVKVNPGGSKKKGKKKNNPGVGRARLSTKWALNVAIEATKGALFAFGGMVATRELPQLIMRHKNVGTAGLVANAAAMLATTAAVSLFSPRAAVAVATGGVLGIAKRYMDEHVSPVAAVANSAAAQVGDVFTMAAQREARALVPAGQMRRTVPPTMIPSRGAGANRPLAAAA